VTKKKIKKKEVRIELRKSCCCDWSLTWLVADGRAHGGGAQGPD